MSSMSPLGGLGKPGARESTQVNVQTQITIPWLRFVSIWAVVSGVIFSLYLLGKAFIWTRADWALLIGIVLLLLVGYGVVRLSQNPLVRVNGRMVNAQYVIDLAVSSWFISAVIVGLVVVSVIVFVQWVLPVITLVLDQEWYIVLAISAAIGLIVSARPLVFHHKRNLENSLFDSSENVYMHSQDQMLNLVKYLDERGELERFDDLYGRVIASRPMPVSGKRIVDMLAEQDMKMQKQLAERESAPAQPVEIIGYLAGHSNRVNNGKGGEVSVPLDKVYRFLSSVGNGGTKRSVRSEWEGVNKADWLSLSEFDAIDDRLDAVGMLDKNGRLIMSVPLACKALGIPLPTDAQDAGQAEIYTGVPSRPAVPPSRPAVNTGNPELDAAVMNLPGIDH